MENLQIRKKEKKNSIGRKKSYRDEIRFWQNVALSLALLSLGILASLVITLISMLLAG